MAGSTSSDFIAQGLPAVGPQRGESERNAFHRLDTLRDVPTEREIELPLIGIPNPGWQCYFISLLQSLLHHRRLATFCRHHHIGPRRNEPEGARLVQHRPWHFAEDVVNLTCGYCQLYELLVRYTRQHLEIEDDETAEEARARHVKDRFGEKLFPRLREYSVARNTNRLETGEQEDPIIAYESLVSWLEGEDLHGDKHQINRAPVEAATEAIFKLRQEKHRQCLHCGHRPDPSQEPFDAKLIVSLGEKGEREVDLVDLLQEQMQIKVDLDCTQCTPGRKTKFSETTKFIHFPELLCIKLEIFSMQQNKAGRYKPFKHLLDLNIPEDLDLKDYATEPEHAAVTYRLFSIVKNIGTSIHSGHYICYIRREDENGEIVWMKYDDEETVKKTFEQATVFSPRGSRAAPYLLFYERIYDQSSRKTKESEDEAEKVLPGWYKPRTSDSKSTSQPVTPTQKSTDPAPGPATTRKTVTPNSSKQNGKKKMKQGDKTYKPPIDEQDDEELTNDEVIEEPETPKTKSRSRPKPKDPTFKPNDDDLEIEDLPVTELSPKPVQKPAPKFPPIVINPRPKPQPGPDPAPFPDPIPSANPKTEPPPTSDEKYLKLTNKALMNELKKRKVPFPSRAVKKTFIELLVRDDAKNGRASDSAGQQGAVTEPSPAPKLDARSDYAKLTVVQLKEILRKRGLPVGGRKADLVARLEQDDASKKDTEDTDSIEKPDAADKSNKRKRSAEDDEEETVEDQDKPKKKAKTAGGKKDPKPAKKAASGKGKQPKTAKTTPAVQDQAAVSQTQTEAGPMTRKRKAAETEEEPEVAQPEKKKKREKNDPASRKKK